MFRKEESGGMEKSLRRSKSKPALRAGGHALMLLASPLNVGILRALQRESMPQQDLRHQLGLPPQSTMRLYLRTLSATGTVEGRSRGEFPNSVEYKITPSGEELLEVADKVETWLRTAPGGPKELGSTGGKSTIKSLVEGWSSNIARALAARPLSLTELNGLIPRISYPSLERRLTAMRQCDLIKARRGEGRLTPYEVTDWLRRAVTPVTAAMAWERKFAAHRTPRLGRLDVEAAFLLAIPLMDLDQRMSGKCRLAVEVRGSASPVFAGVLVCVQEGEVTSCIADLEGKAEAWISGKPLGWLHRMDGDPAEALELGGDRSLGRSMLDALVRTASVPE
jgi:DNA-binding HxlR family transcriptional regulator